MSFVATSKVFPGLRCRAASASDPSRPRPEGWRRLRLLIFRPRGAAQSAALSIRQRVLENMWSSQPMCTTVAAQSALDLQ